MVHAPTREMKHHSQLPPVEWVERVNSSWIVRGGLDGRAREWLDYLASLDDGRLLPSCQAARAMCGLREPLEESQAVVLRRLVLPGHRRRSRALPAALPRHDGRPAIHGR